MSDSLLIGDGWDESFDSEQSTHASGGPSASSAPGEWLVNISEQVVVPMSKNEILEAQRLRRVPPSTLVWRAGMHDWAPLSGVPQLRLVSNSVAPPPRPPPRSQRSPRRTEPLPLLPPPPAPGRPARADQRRRNPLPPGFPVARDAATIREPSGLQALAGLAPPPAQPDEPRPSAPNVALEPPSATLEEALAVYERPSPSLTFPDSIRADSRSPVGAARSRSPFPSRQPSAAAAPQSEPPAPMSEPPPPSTSARLRPPPKPTRTLAPNSLAPTTTETASPTTARSPGARTDLNVVASELRVAKTTSKRFVLFASLGSALAASLITLWIARSPARKNAAASPAPSALTAPTPRIEPQTPSATADVSTPALLAAPVARPNTPAAPASATAAIASRRAPAVVAPHPIAKATPRAVPHPQSAPTPALEATVDFSAARPPAPLGDEQKLTNAIAPPGTLAPARKLAPGAPSELDDIPAAPPAPPPPPAPPADPAQ